MIVITIDEGKNRATARGHAGYAAHGQDIVCAGVSALMTAFAMAAAGAVDAEDGYMSITGTMDADTSAQLRMLRAGLEALAARYPTHVRFSGSGRPASVIQ